jgi:hypothetical protein
MLPLSMLLSRRNQPRFVVRWLLVRIVGNKRRGVIILAVRLVIGVRFLGEFTKCGKVLMDRLDCEFDNESIQAGGGPPSGGPMSSLLVTSPGSAAGEMPSAQRMDRFESRYVDIRLVLMKEWREWRVLFMLLLRR